METNPPNCWVHCHSLPFLAIPFENRLFCPFLAIPCRSSPVLAIPLNHNAPPLDHNYFNIVSLYPNKVKLTHGSFCGLVRGELLVQPVDHILIGPVRLLQRVDLLLLFDATLSRLG